MTDKQCNRNCIYAVDGHCRLEKACRIEEPNCPYQEGNMSILNII